MGKPHVSRYITIGFDTEGRADKFLKIIEGNGLLIKLYETFVDEEGQKKGKINNIQARSAHVWTPSTWERRRFEFGGVTLEFKDQRIASEFLHYAMGFLAGAFDAIDDGSGIEKELGSEEDSEFHKAAIAMALLLKSENVFGAKIERD